MAVPSFEFEMVAEQVVAGDHQLQDVVKKLIIRSLREADRILKEGTPNQRLALIRSLVPAMARQMDGQSTEDPHAEMRAEMQRMFGEMLDAP